MLGVCSVYDRGLRKRRFYGAKRGLEVSIWLFTVAVLTPSAHPCHTLRLKLAATDTIAVC